MNQQPDISIITINYNGLEETCQLIESLQQYPQDCSYEFIVVDNGSIQNEALLLQKKYDKEIKTYLYYLEENEPKKEIFIDEEDLKEDLENINKTTQNILDKKFPKIPYNQNICGLCEFKNYCWGIQ